VSATFVWSGPDALVDALVPIANVSRFPGNPRRGDVEAIAKSLQRFGQQRTILVQRATNYVVAGNHLLDAARLLEWDHIAVTYTDLDETEARAYLLADNQIAARGQNDPEALTAFLRDLAARSGIDEALGFTSEELDRHLLDLQAPDADEVPPLPEPKDVYVKPGELWALGDHRLLIGDATVAESYARLLGDETVQMIWTDPPYGVGYVGGTAEHLTMEGDAHDEVALRALLEPSMALMVERLDPGRAIYVAGPGGDMARIFLDVLQNLGVYRQTIIWVKDALVLGRSDYHWRHEPVYLGTAPVVKRKRAKEGSPVHYGWRPGAAHFFITDRTLDTVWEIPRPRKSTLHPAMKPFELVERSIVASSKRGDIILDPFGGSGTTLISCERAERKARLMEIDPAYGQVIIERFREQTGKPALLWTEP
jgi:DNA modification methylase